MDTDTKSAIGNIATAVGLFALTTGLAIWALNVATEPSGVADSGLPPCVEEDSVQIDCYWDASERGNGEGLDFIVIGGILTYEDGSTVDYRHELLPPCTDAIADAGGSCFGPIPGE
jgi:hypothetical protein